MPRVRPAVSRNMIGGGGQGLGLGAHFHDCVCVCVRSTLTPRQTGPDLRRGALWGLVQVRSLLNPKTVDKATFKGKCVPKPGGYTAFRSHSNSNMLTHPARGQVRIDGFQARPERGEGLWNTG